MLRLLRESRRRAIAFLHDFLMAGISLPLALYLRLDVGVWPHAGTEMLPGALLFAGMASCVFAGFGLYRGLWRYASLQDLLTIAKAVTAALLLFYGGMFLLTRLDWVPRSVPVIHWLLLLAMLGGPRFLYRVAKDRRLGLDLTAAHPRVPVLLVGAGDAAEQFIRECGRNPASPYRPVGLLDRRPERKGHHLHGVRIYGTPRELSRVIAMLSLRGAAPQRLILAEEMEGTALQALLARTQRLGLPMSRLPRGMELVSANPSARLRTRKIKVEDLLGRPQLPQDRASMARLVQGRRVLITGAGGTIGGELARQIAEFGPSEMQLVEISEYALYKIDGELAGLHPQMARQAILGDVRDREGIRRLLVRLKPEVVFHAAAIKHVPLAESNPAEALRTNVLGSWNVAHACKEAGAQAMVLISTDKAVDPASVMGASKRAAERLMLALSGQGWPTRLVIVRFGNVLGSTGSVVPLFRRQIRRGGPVTVTHPDMTRYFMTVREAVGLVLQAAALDSENGGDGGHSYVLEMGEPVKIMQLAEQMIRLAGLEPGQVPIVHTGLRPGEKLHEELFYEAERPSQTGCPGVLRASCERVEGKEVAKLIRKLEDACRDEDVPYLLELLQLLAPEYKPLA